MLALCVLSGAAAQRFFLPSAHVPLGQRAEQVLPAQRSPGSYMHDVGMDRMSPEAFASPQMEGAAEMPAAWKLTGAFILGLGMVSVRTALAVSGQRSTATPRASVSMVAVGDKFPEAVLTKCGVKGKKAVVFFYGSDDSPSCSKEISAFEGASKAFKDAGVAVVGVRNPSGVKDIGSSLNLVVDDGDEMRKELAIPADFLGLLGGRESYVLDASGTVASVHNNQFDPDSHIAVALDAVENLPKPKNPLDQLLANFGGS